MVLRQILPLDTVRPLFTESFRFRSQHFSQIASLPLCGVLNGDWPPRPVHLSPVLTLPVSSLSLYRHAPFGGLSPSDSVVFPSDVFRLDSNRIPPGSQSIGRVRLSLTSISRLAAHPPAHTIR
jgi:hypothetical protein